MDYLEKLNIENELLINIFHSGVFQWKRQDCGPQMDSFKVMIASEFFPPETGHKVAIVNAYLILNGEMTQVALNSQHFRNDDNPITEAAAINHVLKQSMVDLIANHTGLTKDATKK